MVESAASRSAKAAFEKFSPETPLQLTLGMSTDLDELRKKVAGKLLARKSQLPLLEQRRAELERRGAASPSPAEAERCRADAALLASAARLVRAGKERANFEEEIAPLVSCFASLCPDAKMLSFRPPESEKEGDICKILRAAASVAERYYPLDVAFDFFRGVRACRCGSSLAAGDSVCPACQFPVESDFSPTPSVDPKDTDREAKENFKRDFYRYQGIVHNQIPPSLYKSLDAYFIKNRIPPGEIIHREFKLTDEGKRIGLVSDGPGAEPRLVRTSVSMMIEALKKTKNSGYYSDVYHICHEYWGWVLHDLSALEAQIFEDYDRTQVEYNNLVRSGDRKFVQRFDYFSHRKSNISCRFRLYFHLRARGHKCSEDDFKLVTLPGLRMEYRKLLTEIFQKAGIPIPQD